MSVDAPRPMTRAEECAIDNAIGFLDSIAAARPLDEVWFATDSALRVAEQCVQRFEGWRPGSFAGAGRGLNYVRE